MRFQGVDQFAYCLRRYNGVIVEEKDKSSASATRRLVVGFSETLIRRISNQDGFGKFTGHHVGGPIGRAVIDHDHLKLDALIVFEQRIETATQEFAAIPI